MLPPANVPDSSATVTFKDAPKLSFAVAPKRLALIVSVALIFVFSLLNSISGVP